MLARRWIWLVAAVALGCGGDTEMLKVTGSVKYADGLVPRGETARVLFHPTSAGRPASGTIGADGAFELMTETPGDGVLPGTYKVALEIWKSYRERTPVIQEKYGDAASTPLEATVDGDHTHFDFTVER